jgi:hypothetical protein
MPRLPYQLQFLSCVFLFSACAPEFNWRDVRAGAGEKATEVQLQFPCKPGRAERKMVLSDDKAEAAVSFTLTGCSAGDVSFALGAVDVGSAERVAPTLQWLAHKLAKNIGATPTAASAFRPSGADASPHAQQMKIVGKLPDGSAVLERVAVFSQGTRVYQATVMMSKKIQNKTTEEAADSFFTSIKLSPQ